MDTCEATIDTENCCRTHEMAVYHVRMQIADALKASRLPSIDAEILLGLILTKPRAWIIAHADQEMTQESIDAYHRLSERRRAGEPIAFITGTKEFYGRDFIVTPATLIPRPATEHLIDLTVDFLKHPKNRTEVIDTEIVGIARMLSGKIPTTILDIGTGSGCIAVTLALEGIAQKIIAVDISDGAIGVARNNAEKHGAENHITFLHGSGADVIASLQEPFLVVSNPPYIPLGTTLDKTVGDYEPHSALFAGEKGMDVIKEILESAMHNNNCTGILLECRGDQVTAIDALLNT